MTDPRMDRSAVPGLVRRLAEEYSSTARYYAHLWGPAILPLSLPLLEALPLAEAKRVLDVGTGAGHLLPHLHVRAPEGRVVGVDRAEGMARLARERSRLPVAIMDAGALAFPAAVFDVATLAFVLFHVPRPLRALEEASRVSRRGGAVGLVTWSDEDPGLPGGAIWNEELDRRGAPGDPRDARVRRHDLVDRPEKLSRLLEAAGFRAITTWGKRFERQWDAESLLALQRAGGAVGRRLGTLAPEEASGCVAAASARIAALSPEELLWRPVVLYAVARKA